MQPTLLLIDDEENILHSLKRLFRKEPFRVITATSGAEALKLMEREEVSVILSDQRMPKMTGSELLNQIKQTHPNTVRIVMSGYTELESITAAINDGAIFKFLIKPWDDHKLIEHIQEAFSIHEFKITRQKQQESLQQTNRSLGHEVAAKQQETDIYQQGMKLAQSVLEHIPAIVVGLDDRGTMVTANNRARELLSANGLVGLPMELVLPDPLVALIQQALTPANAVQDMKSVTLTLSRIRIRFKVSRFKGPADASGVVLVGCLLDE